MFTENEWVEPTLDKKGFMFKSLTEASKAFVACAGDATRPVIDMGCAYGNVTLSVLKKNKHVIACDLDPRHLEVLMGKVPQDLRKYVTVLQGTFPEDFNFPGKSISAVHLSHVLHFLRGEQIQEGLGKAYHWLEPGGKVFINAGTPYQNILGFVEEYQRREQEDRDWPGEMSADDLKRFISPALREQFPPDIIPTFFNGLTKKALRRALETEGFTVDKLCYFDPDLSPELLFLFGGDGKGWISTIAFRP